MSDQEHSHVEDESTIEISDLQPYEDEDIRSNSIIMPPAPLRVSLRSHLTPRQRFWRLTATTLIVIIVLFLLLGSTPAMRTIAFSWLNRAAIPTSSPVSVATPHQPVQYFMNASPSWGKLSLDGGPFSSIDPTEWLHLNNGQHIFIWRAEPFHTQQCVLSIPAQAGDTCQHASQYSQYGSEVQTIYFYESLKMLPTTQQQALIQTVQTLLDARQATETVRPEELFLHYLSGNTLLEQTTHPLQATHRFLLDTIVASNSSCNLYYHSCSLSSWNGGIEQDCLLFCTPQFNDTSFPVTPNTWNAIVVVHSIWNYKTSNGQTIAENQPDTVPAETQFASLIMLNITWDGTHWHAATGHNTWPDGLACLSAEASGGTVVLYTSPIFGQKILLDYSTIGVPGPTSASGCVVEIQPVIRNSNKPSQSSPIPTPTPTKLPVAYCLYRFGVILAANDAAHQYWPDMPLADSYERGLAQQWVKSHPPNNGA